MSIRFVLVVKFIPFLVGRMQKFVSALCLGIDFKKEYEQELLDILAEIEKKYVLDPFKKIEENIQKMKENVSEELKTETISLISNLPVIQAVQNSGPKRDKNGRFSKKTP